MIKVFLKYTVYVVFFVAIFIALIPKENLYFLLESKLEEKKIIFSKEKIDSKSFSLFIKSPIVFFNEIEILKIADINLATYLLRSKININNIKIADEFKSFIPENIDFIEIKHNILNPLIVEINSKGDFGSLIAKVDLIDNNVVLYLKASQKMERLYQNILKQMKLEKGRYQYEYKY